MFTVYCLFAGACGPLLVQISGIHLHNATREDLFLRQVAGPRPTV